MKPSIQKKEIIDLVYIPRVSNEPWNLDILTVPEMIAVGIGCVIAMIVLSL